MQKAAAEGLAKYYHVWWEKMKAAIQWGYIVSQFSALNLRYL